MSYQKKQTGKSWLLILVCLFTMISLAWQWLSATDYREISNKNQQSAVSESNETDLNSQSTNIAPSNAFTDSDQTTVKNETGTDDQSDLSTSVNSLIPIYLVGAVRVPGIYEVRKGIYLYQLVELAGGLSEQAAADQINLAMQINNNCLIRIPSQEEAENNPGQPIQIIADPTSEPIRIAINSADAQQLDALPGIGPSTARTIVDYRTKNGPFESLEELMKIPGIKQSRFDSIKDLISLN